jgi:hypothetical protein
MNVSTIQKCKQKCVDYAICTIVLFWIEFYPCVLYYFDWSLMYTYTLLLIDMFGVVDIPSKWFWVGGFKDPANGVWKWVNGNRFTFTYWRSGRPSWGNPRCVELNPRWYDYYCGATKPGFICETV